MPGGHVVQIDKTARALEEMGLRVVRDFSSEPELTDIDLVHGFGLTSTEIRGCHRRRVPVTMSTIYWERSYRSDGPDQRLGARSIAGRAVRAARFAGAALHGRSTLIQASLGAMATELEIFSAYESADLLLPNAMGEAESISRDLGVSTPMVPVPNGVDPLSLLRANPPFEDRGYVLFVGRIDPHKNQLGLIRALRGPAFPWSSPATTTPITPPTPSGAAPRRGLGDLHRPGAPRLRDSPTSIRAPGCTCCPAGSKPPVWSRSKPR